MESCSSSWAASEATRCRQGACIIKLYFIPQTCNLWRKYWVIRNIFMRNSKIFVAITICILLHQASVTYKFVNFIKQAPAAELKTFLLNNFEKINFNERRMRCWENVGAIFKRENARTKKIGGKSSNSNFPPFQLAQKDVFIAMTYFYRYSCYQFGKAENMSQK